MNHLLCGILAVLLFAQAGDGLQDAQKAFQNGNYKRAVTLLDKHLETNKEDGKAYLLRARTHAGAKNPAAAQADFARAVELNPKGWAPYFYRGQFQAQEGKRDEALADFNKAIEVAPKNARSFVERGNLYLDLARQKSDHYKLAFGDFHRAIELNASVPGAHLGRAKARLGPSARVAVFRRGDEVFQAVVGYTPFAAFHALPDLAKAVELSPNAPEVRFVRALCFESLQDHAAEVADRKALASLDAKNTQSLNRLAWLLASSSNDKVREPMAALDIAKRLVEQTKGKEFFLFDTLACAQAAAGDFKEAVALQKKVVTEFKAEKGNPLHDRLTLYQQKKPYRISDNPPNPGSPPVRSPQDQDF